MKRKGWILPLAVLMALTLAMPAFADVMWEPYGNNFYEAHRDECQYENRTYLANGPEGYLTLRESPQSSAEVINIVNGESVYVGYLWTDGKGDQWGVAEYGVTSDSGERTWHDGWAPLSQLALVYDHICFEEDHGDELEAYDGSGDVLTEIMVYDYPGGPLAMEDSFQVDVEENPLSQYFEYLYTDENGLRWSKLGYYYGLRNVWVCLDDPMNGELGIVQPQTAAQVRETGENQETLVPPARNVPQASNWAVWLIPVALVALAAAVTALLVRRARGRADRRT